MEEIVGLANVAVQKPIRMQIRDTLYCLIVEGKLKGGDRLLESELAYRMHVSRTPVREALRILEAEGWVEHVPRKGAVVRGLAKNEVTELYLIREALEVLAISAAIHTITAEEISELRAVLDEMAVQTRANDAIALANTSSIFTDKLIKSCKMPRLIELVGTYRIHLRKLRQVTLGQQDRQLIALQEHQAMFQAVVKKDLESAEKLVRQHIKGAMAACLKSNFETALL